MAAITINTCHFVHRKPCIFSHFIIWELANIIKPGKIHAYTTNDLRQDIGAKWFEL